MLCMWICMYHKDRQHQAHQPYICIMMTIKHLPFPGKWTVLWIKAGYFKTLFDPLCSHVSAEVLTVDT